MAGLISPLGSLTLALFVVCVDAHAQGSELPNQVDLRAAYCTKVVEYQISLLTDPTPVSRPPEAQRVLDRFRDNAQSNLRRIRAYLLPRVAYLDALGLMAAMQSADADIQEAKQEASACVSKCNSEPNALGCVLQCNANSEVTEHFQRCRDTSWLPF